MNLDKWDFVLIGRAAGVAIMIGGLVVSGWEALDALEYLDEQTSPFADDRDFVARHFLTGVLQYLFYGALVIGIVEVAARMGWAFGSYEDEEPDEEDADPAA